MFTNVIFLAVMFFGGTSLFAEPPENVLQPILILWGSLGMGHLSAAKAIAEEIRRRRPDVPVILRDVREFNASRMEAAVRGSYEWMTRHHPEFYDSLFRAYMKIGAGTQTMGELPMIWTYRPKKVADYIKNVNPQMIISTFSFATEVLIQLREQGLLREIPIAWQHTDFVDETYFARLAQPIDMTFLPHDRIRQSWIARGVPADRMITTGMPLSARARAQISAEDLATFKAEHDFRSGEKTVLLMGGANGVGNFPLMVKSMIEANQESGHAIRIIAICGNNLAHRSALKKMEDSLAPGVRLEIHGLIPQNDLLGYADSADVIISKTGGLTPLELFYRGKPLILLDVNGGQERYNADLFRELGLAEVVRDQSTVGPIVQRLFNASEESTAMQKNQQDFVSEMHPERIARWALSHPALSKGSAPIAELDHQHDYPRPRGPLWGCLYLLADAQIHLTRMGRYLLNPL